MDLTITVKTSTGNEQTCLDTVSTSIAAVAESRQVGLVIVSNTVDKSDKGVSGDTVSKSITVGETCTVVCSETAAFRLTIRVAKEGHKNTSIRHVNREDTHRNIDGTWTLLKKFIIRE